VKQPIGTNHFQFRFHQFGLGIAGCANGESTSFFYFNHKVVGNASFDEDRSKLDAFNRSQPRW
jgi:hypothetical protein